MNKIKFIVVVSIALLGTHLIYHQVVNGYSDPEPFRDNPELYNLMVKHNTVQELLNYCYQHATDSPNPMQDLINQGLISPEYSDCRTVKSTFDYLEMKIMPMLQEFFKQNLQKCGFNFCENDGMGK